MLQSYVAHSSADHLIANFGWEFSRLRPMTNYRLNYRSRVFAIHDHRFRDLRD